MRSIYFFDPNGVRLELTIDMSEDPVSDSDIETAHVELSKWMSEKAARRAITV
ncbi:hypothetical protein D3C80_2204960 [compost metagenome]